MPVGELKPTNNNDNSLYSPSFDKSEFDSRINNLNRIMKKKTIDMIILFSPDLLYYFTGLYGWSFYTPQFFLLRIDTFDPILIIREMDSPAGLSTTYLKKENILAYPEEYVDNEIKHPIELFNKLINIEDKIGIQSNSTYSRHRYFIELQKFSNNIIDITYVVDEIRSTKSEKELEYIRKASVIADEVMQIALRMVKPGVKICEIAGEIMKFQAIHGTFTGIPPMICVNDKSGHMNWNNSCLKWGDFVRFELAGAYLYYNCPISRSIFIGSEDDLKKSPYADSFKVKNILENGFIRIINYIQENDILYCDKIHSCFSEFCKTYGLYKSSRIAYSFGIGFPPDWQDGGFFSVRENNKEIISCNTALHFIFGCGDNLPYGFSEAVIINNKSIEFLCKTPRKLFFSDSYKYNFNNLFLNNISYLPKLLKFSPYINTMEDWKILNIKGIRNDTEFYKNTSVTKILNYSAYQFHKSLINYKYSELKVYNNVFDIKKLYIKDESCRLGGCSFKILGVSYAIHILLNNNLLHENDILCCTSDGNHGESLAFVSKYIFNFKCKIFLPKNIGAERIDRIKKLDADVFVMDKNYDDTIEYCKLQADKNNWKIISDQSWDGYEEIPRLITEGYSTIMHEVLNYQIPKDNNDITHIFLQCGVGGLASSCAAFVRNWFLNKNKDVKIIIVEPTFADCYRISIEAIHNGKDKQLYSECLSKLESINIGLQCLIPSKVAFPIIRDTADHYLSISDNYTKYTLKYIRQSVDEDLDTAPTGISGVAGLYAARNENLFGLDKNSVVLTINTECNTDTELVNQILTL